MGDIYIYRERERERFIDIYAYIFRTGRIGYMYRERFIYIYIFVVCAGKQLHVQNLTQLWVHEEWKQNARSSVCYWLITCIIYLTSIGVHIIVVNFA